MHNELLILAVIPVVVLLVYIYRKDPVEKEPGKLLAQLIMCGVFAVVPVILIEGVGTHLLENLPYYDLIYVFLENFLVIALVEEGCKFLFLRWRTWKSPAFDFAFDGIVYAVFVSLGFALAENIGYVLEFGFYTAILRAFTAIPGHCVFAVFMGYFYAQAAVARVEGNRSKVRSNMFLAVLVPLLCHGTYDVLASVDDEVTLAVFFVFLIAMVVVGIRLVRKEAREARRLFQVVESAEFAVPAGPTATAFPSEPAVPADQVWPTDIDVK